MKNKKGFTLVEILSAVAIVSVVSLIGFFGYRAFRTNALEKQFENIKLKIEMAAEKYSMETNIFTMTVGQLLEDGYLDEEAIDPRDESSLDCRIINVDFQKGKYNATLTDQGEAGEDGTCSVQTMGVMNTSIDVVCIDDIEKCESAIAKTGEWYTGKIKLIPGENLTNIASLRWSSDTGFFSTDTEIEVDTSSTLSTVFTLNVTFDDGSTGVYMREIKIDNELPQIINIEKDDRWRNYDKEVTTIASDSVGSGVEKYYIGSDNSCPEANFVTKNKETLPAGTYYACAMDAVGNKSTPTSFEVLNIDKTAPTSGNFETESSTQGITYYSELTRKVAYTDNESGIDKIKYCITTSSTCTPNEDASILKGATSTAKISLPTHASAQKICTFAIDNAGNTSTPVCDAAFLVDKTAPTTPQLQTTSEAFKKQITSADAESGINKVVCSYGQNSNNLNQSVVVNNPSGNIYCNLTDLENGKTYYIKATVYNNANLTSESGIETFQASLSAKDAYSIICGTSEYCNKNYYINYSGKIFAAYKKVTNGIRLISNAYTGSYYYTRSGCCNDGHCKYANSNYTSGLLAQNLNNTFLKSLASYTTKLNSMTLNTGVPSNVAGRTVTAYVGVLDYNEYNIVKNYANVYNSSHSTYSWLLTPVSTSAYISNYVAKYNAITSQVVNTTANSRATIELKNEVVFISGDGSLSNPFKVV